MLLTNGQWFAIEEEVETGFWVSDEDGEELFVPRGEVWEIR